ncbi:glycosyltransferase family 4 protein [Ideonella sp. BN130291]|uniref:glycosyltransferase family 4 protein n=1 Tax=Ideonella sp. BN130291 TaxID=3112940 RepID=UPI002E26F699|nr:glycosyltransferase family 4 protein [Ideonella sp. BN130291]
MQMNIALVAPSPVPFVLGGAEHLALGLQRFINEQTAHRCELFKVSVLEHNLPDLLMSYRTFSRLDLSSFDRVVSTKYPSWMVQHPSHVVYMLHTLRGLYDAYHFMNQPLECDYDTPHAQRVRDEMHRIRSSGETGREALERFFDLVQEGLGGGQLSSSFTRFPGPFARDVVHFLDGFAMQPARMAGYAAISRTVRDRAGYFPAGQQVSVLYPPPRLEGFRCGGDDYLFTISRLDVPKRVRLLIEAMCHVKADIPLLIGGTGPDEPALRHLAGNDPRIRFLGPLTDSQVLDLYADALVIPFVPYDEDYGLITLEAMMSGKPVLTVADAGGVNEFVVDGETGLCVPPEPLAIASAIDKLCEDRSAARRMGEEARRRVGKIGWRTVVEGLLGQELAPAPRARRVLGRQWPHRPRMVVTVTFPVHPPRGGGQSRVFHLYRHLARHFDITLVTLGPADQPRFDAQIAPGLREIRIPKTEAHQAYENQQSQSVGWIPVTDIVAAMALHLTPAYGETLEACVREAHVLVACHPYLAREMCKHKPGLPLWYEAQDVEWTLKQQMLGTSGAALELAEVVRSVEAEAWHAAEFVFACTAEDLQALTGLYGPTRASQLVVPNGFAEDEVRFTPPLVRQRLAKVVGLSGRSVLFMGSWHGPNFEAMDHVRAYAEALPDVSFLIVGSVGLKYAGSEMPSNVKLLGVVDDEEKQVLLSAADVAVNPMLSGTGSNLKMFDYLAAGLPVVSTPFGARGIDIQPGRHYIASETQDFPVALMDCFIRGIDESLVRNASDFVREHYAWNVIAERVHAHLREHLL